MNTNTNLQKYQFSKASEIVKGENGPNKQSNILSYQETKKCLDKVVSQCNDHQFLYCLCQLTLIHAGYSNLILLLLNHIVSTADPTSRIMNPAGGTFGNAFFRGVVSASDEFNSYIYAIRLKMAGTISSAERLARRQALAFQKPHWLTTPWLTTSNPPKRKFEEVEPQCEKVPPLKLRRVYSHPFPENLFEEDLWEVVN